MAALVAAAMVRKNPTADVVPFESNAITPDKFQLNPRDSVMTNAQKLASLPSGGTNCSAPLAYVNSVKAKGDLIVYVSDNESWVDTPMHGRFGGNATETMKHRAAAAAFGLRDQHVAFLSHCGSRGFGHNLASGL